MRPVWLSFIDLSNARGVGMSGPSPITYEQIKAYIDVMQTNLSPREIEVIKKLDMEYLKVLNE